LRHRLRHEFETEAGPLGDRIHQVEADAARRLAAIGRQIVDADPERRVLRGRARHRAGERSAEAQ
jgi:hypothetical protein